MKKIVMPLMVFAGAILFVWQSSAGDMLVASGEAEVPVAEAPRSCQTYVYVSGAVRKPGLYSFPKEIRVGEAVHEAGDLAAYADEGAVNMAEPVTDGMHIHIPYELDGVPVGAEEANGLININEADEKKLTELSGIGPAMAKNIIAYRSAHGGFTQIDELRKVKGIGQTKFNALKDKVTV
ncbi:MAG: ComEA family DNA-binding protein [Megasphaera sp.]|nr:ComEA family DNA-binding protein [Megasphaera sp.]MCH4217076.1 ComEA family DNA-binding protein [Megasphaera sp.]